MNPREFVHPRAVQDEAGVESGPQPEYCLTLTIAVHHAEALWDAAAKKAMAAPSTQFEDVLAVIGPREDPSIADCIAMLVFPEDLTGCEVDDFWIHSMPGLPTKRDLTRLG